MCLPARIANLPGPWSMSGPRGTGRFVPKPTSGVVCQDSGRSDLRSSVRRRPLASVANGCSCYSLGCPGTGRCWAHCALSARSGVVEGTGVTMHSSATMTRLGADWVAAESLQRGMERHGAAWYARDSTVGWLTGTGVEPRRGQNQKLGGPGWMSSQGRELI